MAKTSVAERTARDVIDDDTAAEGRLVAMLAAIERLVWLAAADGEFSPQEMREIAGALRGSHVEAVQSLDRNRLAAGLLCLHVAGIEERTILLPCYHPLGELEEERACQRCEGSGLATFQVDVTEPVTELLAALGVGFGVVA